MVSRALDDLYFKFNVSIRGLEKWSDIEHYLSNVRNTVSHSDTELSKKLEPDRLKELHEMAVNEKIDCLSDLGEVVEELKMKLKAFDEIEVLRTNFIGKIKDEGLSDIISENTMLYSMGDLLSNERAMCVNFIKDADDKFEKFGKPDDFDF